MNKLKASIITLKAEDELFQCSKEVLTASSDYFKAMFSDNFIESQRDCVMLKDIEADALRKILSFISGDAVLLCENVGNCLSILQSASMLQFSQIEKLCEDYLVKELSCENCLEVYEISSCLNSIRVAEAALTFSLWWFEEVIQSEFFLNLSNKGVQDFLSRPQLHLGYRGEWAVCEAILNWIENDESKRKEHLPSLLQCLDFSALSIDDISNLKFYDIVGNDKSVCEFLDAVKNCKKNLEETGKVVKRNENGELESCSSESLAMMVVCGKKSVKRKLPGIPCMVCEKTKGETGGLNAVLCSYSFTSGKLKQLVHLSKMDQSQYSFQTLVGFRVCSVGPVLYVTGGQYVIGGNTWNCDVWSYNTISDTWKIQPSLPEVRRNHMMCVLGSHIYLLGGFGKHRISLNTMAVFNTKTENWLKRSEMPFYGVGAACSFKGRILVFINCALYIYYPERESWVSTGLKCDHNKSFSVAVPYNESVYLLGSHSKMVYKISPDVSDRVDFFGTFQYETVNMCVAEDNLVSFALAGRFSEDERSVVEVMSLIEETQIDLKSGIDWENSNSIGKDLNSRYGKIVWEECVKDDSSQMTFHSYNESCYGCFNLFKLPEGSVLR